MIFIKNLKSVSDQEWSTTDKYPGVRWKFLIDSDYTGSSGLSLGFAEIEPGELEEIKKGDVVYIAGNAKHALKNNGSETLKFYWIFPTDSFSEVGYLY